MCLKGVSPCCLDGLTRRRRLDSIAIQYAVFFFPYQKYVITSILYKVSDTYIYCNNSWVGSKQPTQLNAIIVYTLILLLITTMLCFLIKTILNQIQTKKKPQAATRPTAAMLVEHHSTSYGSLKGYLHI